MDFLWVGVGIVGENKNSSFLREGTVENKEKQLRHGWQILEISGGARKFE